MWPVVAVVEGAFDICLIPLFGLPRRTDELAYSSLAVEVPASEASCAPWACSCGPGEIDDLRM